MTSKKSKPLAAFGTLVRETRVRRGLTQDRAAKEAGVSRKQLALLEQGQNASAEFIMKVARFLAIKAIPLGDGIHATLGSSGGIDVTRLFSLADELVALASAVAGQLRDAALDATLPHAGAGDAREIAEVVARNERIPRNEKQVRQTLHGLAADVPSRKPSSLVHERSHVEARKRTKS